MHLSHLVCYEKWKMRGNHSLNAKCIKAIQYAPKKYKMRGNHSFNKKCIWTIQYAQKSEEWEEIIHLMQNASKQFIMLQKCGK